MHEEYERPPRIIKIRTVSGIELRLPDKVIRSGLYKSDADDRIAYARQRALNRINPPKSDPEPSAIPLTGLAAWTDAYENEKDQEAFFGLDRSAPLMCQASNLTFLQKHFPTIAKFLSKGE